MDGRYSHFLPSIVARFPWSDMFRGEASDDSFESESFVNLNLLSSNFDHLSASTSKILFSFFMIIFRSSRLGFILHNLPQVHRTPVFFLQFCPLRSHALLLSLVGRAKDYSRIYLRKSLSRWLLFVHGVPPGSKWLWRRMNSTSGGVGSGGLESKSFDEAFELFAEEINLK